MKYKKIEKAVNALMLVSLVFMLIMAYDASGRSVKASRERALNNLREKTLLYITEKLSSAVAGGTSSGLFREAVISIDLGDFSVKPESLKNEVISRIEFKAAGFDAAVFEKLKALRNVGDPYAVSIIFSYYLNGRNDGYIYEKAVLYLYLISVKLSIKQGIEKEASALNALISYMPSEKEKGFFISKLKELISQSGGDGGAADFLSSLFSREPRGGDVYSSALIDALKRDVLSGAADIAIKDLISGGKPELMVSGKVSKSVYAAALIDRKALGAYLEKEHGALLSEDFSGAPFFFRLSSAFYVKTGRLQANINYLEYFAYYLPALIVAAVFAFIKMRENEAVRLSYEMTEFVSKISHQLKTPLSSSILYLELAEKQFAAGDAVKAGESVRLAFEQASSLSFLFENFTALNRLFSENVKLNMDVTDLEEEIVKYIKPYQYQMETGKLKIVLDIPEPAEAFMDRWAFYNILNNIISNSLKYAGKEPVEITVGVRGEAGKVKVSISDNGRGINAADADRIFDKFYKGSNASGDFRSSGLGLFIARSLAAKMGGDLKFFRPEAGGAGFELSLPAHGSEKA